MESETTGKGRTTTAVRTDLLLSQQRTPTLGVPTFPLQGNGIQLRGREQARSQVFTISLQDGPSEGSHFLKFLKPKGSSSSATLGLFPPKILLYYFTQCPRKVLIPSECPSPPFPLCHSFKIPHLHLQGFYCVLIFYVCSGIISKTLPFHPQF